MRLCDFLIRTKIGLDTFNMACSFLHLNQLKLNSYVPDDELQLITETIKDENFREWFITKLKIENVEINNARKLIAVLYIDNTKYSNLDAERIINALIFLIERKAIPKTIEAQIQLILSNDYNDPLERITEVQKVFLEYKQNLQQEKEKIKKEKEEKLKKIEKKRRDEEDYIDLSFDPDSEEAVMRALRNGYGDLYGFD